VRASSDPRDRRWRLVGGATAVTLVALLLAVARPATVWQLLRSTDVTGLLPAAAMAACALALRGVRLKLLLPPRLLPMWTATQVASAAHAAALFVPARLGELALPVLLHRVANWEYSAGVGTLLVARTFDLAALGVWAGIAIVAVWGFGQPWALVGAAILLVPPLILPKTLAVVDAIALRTLAPRGVRGRRWTRRIRRVRRTLTALRSRPLRVVGAAVTSLAVWAALWGLTWYLLVAMGYRWSLSNVIAGSAAASLTNLLPINLLGNFGTLEAGWTAAFIALGVPPDVAAATGFACHLWALVFAAIFGAVAWGLLSVASKPRRSGEVEK
jgi:uncharacterized protein (TIRG00374 family)